MEVIAKLSAILRDSGASKKEEKEKEKIVKKKVSELKQRKAELEKQKVRTNSFYKAMRVNISLSPPHTQVCIKLCRGHYLMHVGEGGRGEGGREGRRDESKHCHI